MKKQIWYYIWGGLFIVCALLGFIPEPEGLLKVIMVLTSLIFFIPGWALLYTASQEKDRATLVTVRTLSLISLASTLVFLVLNLMSGNATVAAGDLLYGFLIIFSSPMVCAQYWIVSLFLWACLLMTSLSELKKLKKAGKK